MTDSSPKTDKSTAPSEMFHSKYAEDWFAQFGLDITLVGRSLVIALVTGIVAALIDEGLGLPSGVVFLTAGSIVGALNGATYACFKRCHDRAGLVIGIVSGWLATFAWFLALDVFAHSSPLIFGLDWFEVTITGLLTGLLGFVWSSVTHAIPSRLTT